MIVDFPAGSFVKIRNLTRRSKLEEEYEGPFKVVRKTRGGSYVLQDFDGNLLERNYPPRDLTLISGDPTPDSESYEVEQILNHRAGEHGYEYLVKWKGYDAEYNTWEPESSFNTLVPIQTYWDRRK